MPLSDTAIRAAKPKAAQYKLFDEGGLLMIVKPGGGKLWRLKYRVAGKEQQLSLGRYPEVALKEARERRDAARKLLAAGKDPSEERRLVAMAKAVTAANTFRSIANELIQKQEKEGRSPKTIKKTRWLLSLLDFSLGARPVVEILAHELLAALRQVEGSGRNDTARRLRSFASAVFRYAIATARAVTNPADALQGSLIAPKVKHRAALLEPKAVGGLLRAIDDYQGQPATKLALQLIPHVFVRPGELRRAEWPEFDLDKEVWKIPAAKMKMRVEHAVPLSSQAVGILRQAKTHTGTGQYVFPSIRSLQKPMSENTLNAALRRLGYSKDEMTTHGFRSVASTLLNESGKWSPDAIERALAHKGSDALRAVYHRGSHWQERVKMAQWWSDFLDTLREGGRVIQFEGRKAQ